MPTDIIPFAVEHTEIAGLEILQMKQITDERGTVREFYRESSFLEAGLPSLGPWLQVNITETRQGALRGLHGEQNRCSSWSPSLRARRSAPTWTPAPTPRLAARPSP
jgi:dTDP-4-dehydrorhamnose 3,5-epimerase